MIPVYYSARSLWAHRLSTGLSVLGLALVVFVFTAVLTLAHGIEQALSSGGSIRNVVVLRDGATSEIVSSVERDALRVLESGPELATSPEGDAMAAGEWMVLVSLTGLNRLANITLRGVQPLSLQLRPMIRVVEGRAPMPGTNEVMIGNDLAGRFDGAFVGGALRFSGQTWPVVGRFDAGRSAYESEVWADGERVSAVFDRPTYSSVVVRVKSDADVDAFIHRAEQKGRFQLTAKREDKYWEEQGTGLATFVRVLGLFVAFVFSVGAGLGAMITMYAQVAARIRELATLRAIGFRRRSVLAAVLVESIVLGATGGVLGSVSALALRWVKFRTLNFQTFSEVKFEFIPTPTILLVSALFGVVLGLAGGLLPAVRAARLPILEAIR